MRDAGVGIYTISEEFIGGLDDAVQRCYNVTRESAVYARIFLLQ